jgi:hypothetical protein
MNAKLGDDAGCLLNFDRYTYLWIVKIYKYILCAKFEVVSQALAKR